MGRFRVQVLLAGTILCHGVLTSADDSPPAPSADPGYQEISHDPPAEALSPANVPDLPDCGTGTWQSCVPGHNEQFTMTRR